MMSAGAKYSEEVMPLLTTGAHYTGLTVGTQMQAPSGFSLEQLTNSFARKDRTLKAILKLDLLVEENRKKVQCLVPGEISY